MPNERYCSHCGDHVRCREETVHVPDSVRTRLRLSCPNCGKELGAVYDAELRMDPTRRL